MLRLNNAWRSKIKFNFTIRCQQYILRSYIFMNYIMIMTVLYSLYCLWKPSNDLFFGKVYLVTIFVFIFYLFVYMIQYILFVFYIIHDNTKLSFFIHIYLFKIDDIFMFYYFQYFSFMKGTVSTVFIKRTNINHLNYSICLIIIKLNNIGLLIFFLHQRLDNLVRQWLIWFNQYLLKLLILFAFLIHWNTQNLHFINML